MIKVILIHGNGGGNAYDAWLPDAARQLEKLGVEVINESFPDPVSARSSIWLPFLESLGPDENTVVVGYSSGAVAAMRYAEDHQLLGSVLVGACYTDLGDASERVSGYYIAPWQWDAIRTNQQWIIQFASKDDPYIPIAEPRYIQKHLQTKYFELDKRGHFMDNTFPELVKAVQKQLNL
jgi:pimeloyl-ACP methyl ester carboxylesterase